MRICIAVPTYRRPLALARALRSLAGLEDVGAHEYVIAVFDNDAAGSAEPIVSRESSELGLRCAYIRVPRKGLSMVRNAVLDHALGDDYDYLAMLDDDEEVQPTWLRELLSVQAETRADAVLGRVDTRYPTPPSAWIRAFRESEYPRLSDQAVLEDGWTSNALLFLRSPALTGLRFDPELNLAGGEDQFFFRSLLARGGHLRYAEFAVVTETLPDDRTQRLSVVKRSFRRGTSLAFCDRKLAPNVAKRSLRLAKGAGAFLIGSLRCLLETVAGRRDAAMASAIEAARGAGMLTGSLGIAYHAYHS